MLGICAFAFENGVLVPSYRVTGHRTDRTDISTASHVRAVVHVLSWNGTSNVCVRVDTLTSPGAYGRMAHDTRIPSVESAHLHPIASVVCRPPAPYCALWPDGLGAPAPDVSEYLTAASPNETSTSAGHVEATDALPVGPWKSSFVPLEVAMSQSVRPSTATCPWRPPMNCPSVCFSNCVRRFSPSRAWHPPRSVSSLLVPLKAMFTAAPIQWSSTFPASVTPAIRRTQNGSRSGVVRSTSSPLPSAGAADLFAVMMGVWTNRCSAAFSRLCRAEAKLWSKSGYRRNCSGILNRPQTFPKRDTPTTPSERMDPTGVTTSRSRVSSRHCSRVSHAVSSE